MKLVVTSHHAATATDSEWNPTSLSQALPHHPTIEYFVDAIEISLMIGLHPRTVQQMARDGIIPAHPLGTGQRKTWRFLRSEVQQSIKTQVNSDSHPCRSSRRKPK